MPFEFVDLIGYWKKGQLYSSQVERGDNGYIPRVGCSWTTQYQRSFFGFNSALGSFEITPNTANPMSIILDASIALGSPAVSVAVHPSGREFAVGTLNGAVAICDIEQGRITRSLRANQSRTWALAYSPIENILIRPPEWRLSKVGQ